MITAVLDTNVLASGLAGFANPRSIPGQLLRAWQEGRYRLVVADVILVELEHTLAKPYFRGYLAPEQVERALLLLRRRAQLAAITAVVQGVATHPEDDRVLAAAVSLPAGYLVTGDKKLQQLGTYQGVRIVSPRAFLDILESGAGDE